MRQVTFRSAAAFPCKKVKLIFKALLTTWAANTAKAERVMQPPPPTAALPVMT